MEYGKNKKKYVFYLTDHQHARLVAKLQYDEIKQAAFLIALIDAYVDDDPDIRRFVEKSTSFKLKEATKKQHAKERRKIALEEYKFNLPQEELDNIFDILENEENDG
jgi:hypothetical protein